MGNIKTLFGGHSGPVIDIKVIKTTTSNILYSMSSDNTLRTWDTVVRAQYRYLYIYIYP